MNKVYCRSCIFWEFQDTGGGVEHGYCRRYPTSVETTETHWCGEGMTPEFLEMRDNPMLMLEHLETSYLKEEDASLPVEGTSS